MKIIWATNGTIGYLMGLSSSDLANELEEYHSVSKSDITDYLEAGALYDAVYDFADDLSQEDEYEFEDEILPEINRQTRDGKVILVSEDGGGRVVDASELNNLKLFSIPLYQPTEALALGDEDGLHLLGVTVRLTDGDPAEIISEHFDYTLYAIPETDAEFRVFVDTCLSSAKDSIADIYQLDDPTEEIAKHLDEYIDECDFSAVSECCEPIKLAIKTQYVDYRSGSNTMNESVKLTEVSSKVPSQLKVEFDAIMYAVDAFGLEEVTSKPFLLGDPADPDINSVEYNYPEFARIVKAFKKELSLDEDIDDLWDGLSSNPADWQTIKDTCRLLTERSEDGSYKRPSVQIEKVYKKYYKAFDESLEEDDESRIEEDAESMDSPSDWPWGPPHRK